MHKLFLIFYILIVVQVTCAQENSLQELQNRYTAFEYREVIKIADQLLSLNNFTVEETTQIYELKGLAHFAIGEEGAAREAFELLLNINSNYTMDQRRISPKIVSFFNEIKISFLDGREQQRPILDSLRVFKESLILQQENYKYAVIKNLFVPGWGQFQLNNPTKGYIYSILSITSITSAIVYIIKTNDKQRAYLNEANKVLIPSKYDEYNSSYKIRNLLIAGAAMVWLASQIDILFFTEINSLPTSNRGLTNFTIPQDLRIGLSIPLN